VLVVMPLYSKRPMVVLPWPRNILPVLPTAEFVPLLKRVPALNAPSEIETSPTKELALLLRNTVPPSVRETPLLPEISPLITKL
jgi:hypothetical protein